jgi:hypothetical protein
MMLIWQLAVSSLHEKLNYKTVSLQNISPLLNKIQLEACKKLVLGHNRVT